MATQQEFTIPFNGDDVHDAELTSQWFRKYAGSESPQVLAFCKTHEIVEELKKTVALVENCFWRSPIRLEEDTDPQKLGQENSDYQCWRCTTSRAKGGALAAYREFVKELVAIATLGSTLQVYCSLSYDIL